MPAEFERRVAATIESICEQARTLATHEGDLPKKEVRRLARPEGDLQAVTASELDWVKLAATLEEAPGVQDQLFRALDVVEENRLVKFIVSDDEFYEPVELLWHFVIVPILKRYQALHESWGWDEDSAFRSIADWSEAQEERLEGNHRTMAPLRHLQGPEAEIHLGEGIAIRPFTDADREALWRSFGEDRLDPGVLQNWTHTIDCRWEESSREPPLSHGPGMELVSDVVRALRLHHPGMAATTIVWTCPYPPAEDVEVLAQLFQGLRKGRADRRLELALRRFDTAYERYDDEDRLVDLWIAFEALLLPDGRSELSYRAALRIALLAADDGAARREAFRQARLSYNSRSQVVHGEAVKAGLEIVVEQTRELARKVLRAWVLDPPSGGIEEIDQLLFV